MTPAPVKRSTRARGSPAVGRSLPLRPGPTTVRFSRLAKTVTPTSSKPDQSSSCSGRTHLKNGRSQPRPSRMGVSWCGRCLRCTEFLKAIERDGPVNASFALVLSSPPDGSERASSSGRSASVGHGATTVTAIEVRRENVPVARRGDSRSRRYRLPRKSNLRAEIVSSKRSRAS